MTDMVNHPPHYVGHPAGIECIDVTQHLNFCIGNAIKYCWRADLKGNAIQDLQKAIFYLETEISRRKENEKKLNSKKQEGSFKAEAGCSKTVSGCF